jgi:hypothetical protein
MPLLMVVVSPAALLVPIVFGASLGVLALLGAIGAKAGGANVLRATARVTFWGAFAMALTAGIGKLIGTVVCGLVPAEASAASRLSANGQSVYQLAEPLPLTLAVASCLSGDHRVAVAMVRISV